MRISDWSSDVCSSDLPWHRARRRAFTRQPALGLLPAGLLPVRVLSRLFRRLFLEKLIAAYEAGHLQFFGDHTALREPEAFATCLAPLREVEWVVYAKRP